LPSGEQIQTALRGFVDKWRDYQGTEKSEAQTFLNELFACYGSDRRELGARFEHFAPAAGFMDLFWPGVCIFEMKAPVVKVQTARAQIERYWRESADYEAGLPAARWIIICNFGRFQIWEPGRFPTHAVAEFDLTELPERYDALAFLAGPTVEPNFTEHYREITQEAAKAVAKVYHSLADRGAAPPDEIQRFVLQSVWCMFAEDLGLLDAFPLQATLNEVRAQPERSAAEIGFLFRVLNQKTNHNRKGRLAGTKYVNGELFADPAEVALDRSEIELMLEATGFDWRQVDPTIFGSLLEGVLGHDRRWELGAHYTHEVDIMKIVGPTIIRPWRERIEATTTPSQARELLDELCRFRVLDPACGCGNFLYVAYRELRGLEHELKIRIRALASQTGLPIPAGSEPYFPLANMQGIDIERSAVLIARVTLWMGHRQMMDRYGEAEPPLPLQDLSSIRQGDALKLSWPETDCVIGNPPFLGAKFIRPSFGDDYAEWLISAFSVGVKDFCVYWFRKTHAHLIPGQRAGLVGTNSVSQTGGRKAALDYIVKDGGVITDAISSQKWPGEAAVHVSLVNWVRSPDREPTVFTLNGVQVPGITTQLSSAGDSPEFGAARLASNRGMAFAGVVPQGKGFLIDSDFAASLLDDRDIDYKPVVRQYLAGDDITSTADQLPTRWILDFGSMPLEQAMNYPRALAHLRSTVRLEREDSKNRAVEHRWWLFGRRVEGMREALVPLQRFAAAASTSKRLSIAWQDAGVTAMNTVCVFAFEDDYSMGVVLSRCHEAWAWHEAGTLETRLRYTSAAVFETFPWPDPVTTVLKERVADVSRRLLARRDEICRAAQIGITKLYNAVDEGAWTDLMAVHKDLDEAVAECYGWPKSAAQDDAELVRRLTDLNREISDGRRPYDPFG